MELRHIRYFLAVAECMNFTKAAEKLCIAQPPLSRQIQDLEDELGTPLFIRKPRHLQLTEEGLRFRQYAVQILSLVEKSEEALKEMNLGLSGTIYLGTVEGCGPWRFAEWIAAFREKYPKVQYNIWNGSSDDIIERIMNGLCDLAIITEPHNEEGVHSVPVAKEPWVALIPSSFPIAEEKGESINIRKLAPYPLIIPSRASRMQEIEEWFGTDPEERPELNICARVSNMINAYELAYQGVGISIYPASVASLVHDDSVVIKKLTSPSVTASYILIRKKGQQLSHAAREFLSFIEQNI